MFRFRLDTTDLGSMTIAATPVGETVSSLLVWTSPHLHPEHAGLLRASADAFARCDTVLLSALISARRWIPDFLIPRPGERDESFAAALASVATTPPETVTADILDAYGPQPLPPVLADATRDPAGLLARVIGALAEYWDLVIAPHWPRLKAILEADAAHRGGVVVTRGIGAMLNGLAPNLRWENDAVTLSGLCNEVCVVEVSGRELRLVPSLFLHRATTLSGDDFPPVIHYPARGRGDAWESRQMGCAAVERLVGSVRAALLTRLTIPATTTELSRETGDAPPTINRHLTALHRAGLLERVRRGRSVYYSRTAIGDQLIDASG